MSVTVIAEFDSVDFAERAARRVKNRFPQATKATIRCKKAPDDRKTNRFAVPVLDSFRDTFQVVAFTSNLHPSASVNPFDKTEEDERKSALLEITAERTQSQKIAGLLLACGGYDVHTV